MSANLQQIWWTSEQRGEEMRKIENGGTAEEPKGDEAWMLVCTFLYLVVQQQVVQQGRVVHLLKAAIKKSKKSLRYFLFFYYHGFDNNT